MPLAPRMVLWTPILFYHPHTLMTSIVKRSGTTYGPLLHFQHVTLPLFSQACLTGYVP